MKNWLCLVIGLVGGWFSIFPSPNLAQLSLDSFQKKDFLNAARLAKNYLDSQETLSPNDPIVEIYFKTESNLFRLEEFLEKLYTHSEDPVVYTYIYYFLEKCYHAKELQMSEKWGEIFLTEGGENSYYAKGILAYSGILYLKEEKKKAKQILKAPLFASTKGVLKKRFHLLKLALKREEKIILSASHFLDKNLQNPYADFVMALIIESYKKIGEEQKAKEWSKKLEKTFPNSVFLRQI